MAHAKPILEFLHLACQLLERLAMSPGVACSPIRRRSDTLKDPFVCAAEGCLSVEASAKFDACFGSLGRRLRVKCGDIQIMIDGR